MENLIEKAFKALDEHPSYNEITLVDGSISVHVIRYTPIPYIIPNAYSFSQK